MYEFFGRFGQNNTLSRETSPAALKWPQTMYQCTNFRCRRSAMYQTRPQETMYNVPSFSRGLKEHVAGCHEIDGKWRELLLHTWYIAWAESVHCNVQCTNFFFGLAGQSAVSKGNAMKMAGRVKYRGWYIAASAKTAMYQMYNVPRGKNVPYKDPCPFCAP